MLISFMPDWMLDAKPSGHGVLENVMKVNRLQTLKEEVVWLLDHLDLPFPPPPPPAPGIGLVSTILRAKVTLD